MADGQANLDEEKGSESNRTTSSHQPLPSFEGNECQPQVLEYNDDTHLKGRHQQKAIAIFRSKDESIGRRVM